MTIKRLNETEVARQLARKIKSDETIWDTHVRGFGLRLRPSGSANYVAGGRWGGKSFSQRPAANARLVPYEEGFAAVKALLLLNEQKRNPDEVRAEQERAQAVLEAERQRQHGFTYNVVADDYCRLVVSKTRQATEARRYIDVGRKAWGDRPPSEAPRATNPDPYCVGGATLVRNTPSRDQQDDATYGGFGSWEFCWQQIKRRRNSDERRAGNESCQSSCRCSFSIFKSMSLQ